MWNYARGFLLVLFIFAVMNVGVVLAQYTRIQCSACTQNAFAPTCGFQQQNVCTSINCGVYPNDCPCILWVNYMVDTCQRNNANDCQRETTNVVCTVGTYMRFCFPPDPGCFSSCNLGSPCTPINLTLPKCHGNYLLPLCPGE